MDACRDLFPFPTSVSLEPVVEFWKREAGDPDSVWNVQARAVLDALDGVPALTGPSVSRDVLSRHEALVQRTVVPLLPVGIDQDILAGIAEPFRPGPLLQTEAARALGVFDPETILLGLPGAEALMTRGRVLLAYQHILRERYGLSTGMAEPLVVTLPDPDTGLDRHYQMDWHKRFTRLLVRGDLPKLERTELESLIAHPENLPAWMELLPPELFEFNGLSLTIATDVTAPETLSRLKDELLQRDSLADSSGVARLQRRVAGLLRRPDVEVGLIALHRGAHDVDSMAAARPVGRSLLLSQETAPSCPLRTHSHYASVLETRKPVVIPDLEAGSAHTGWEQHLLGQGIRSLVLAPLLDGDRLIGVLEVGDPEPGAFNAFTLMRLDEPMVVFSTAVLRALNDRDDRIAAVIKRNYTAIHPSVEWRFRDAADAWLDRESVGTATPVEEIVFRDVYPLYGLTDMRGSSDLRHDAIRRDLVDQLERGLAVVRAALAARETPALEELAYRLGQFVARIRGGFASEEETRVLSFLATEVEPHFETFEAEGPEVAERVRDYREALDPELGVVYRARKSFEDAIARVNSIIACVVDEEEKRAQALLPHFFERFATDGVDHNIYAGQALLEHADFSPLDLRTLRLWQLELMCRVEWALGRHRDETPDLVGTHLVLVQHDPLAIRFRTSEKRFDVDGAYNIRYEIVKKRIDKAHVRGTSERLTQPGRLAIVYSRDEERQEYLRYLDYLIARGFLAGEIEELELEDLQGVYGLHAFRVTIAPDAPERAAPAAEAVDEAPAERPATREAIASGQRPGS